MTNVGILLCAGSAARMGFDKLTAPLGGRTAIERAAEALIEGGAERLILTTGPATRAYIEGLRFAVPHTLAEGGETRTESVRRALRVAAGEIALIHDAARCFVSPLLVRRCLESAIRFGSGVAAIKATDTALLEAEAGGGITVVPRERLWLMQTPQAFRLAAIRAAYERRDIDATDDATLFAAAGHTLHFVESTADNFKLTQTADWARAQRIAARYGTGFDTHRLVEGRPLILGGVTIPFDKGLDGHSDADALVHAIMDALLGAAALGDIGQHFPDSDSQYRQADSMLLLKQVAALLKERGFCPAHIDATVIAERPKLAPYREQMRANIAAALKLPIGAVSVKATTTEGMNDEGRGLCISAQAVASLQ